ncbi:MAG: hypothetical protein LUH46_01930 [Alistipes sp.]|nr:hypothetical protein [Alistipes sp.]
MDLLKEQTRPATKSSKHPRIEVDEEMVRRMITGLVSLDSNVNNGILNGLKHKTRHTCSMPVWLTINLKNVVPWIH